MEQQKGMFSELLNRRIPQILGMYVASLWLCVEIADWMSERFPVPDTLSSHVFVFLLVLLPAAGILAWGHGKPGKMARHLPLQQRRRLQLVRFCESSD